MALKQPVLRTKQNARTGDWYTTGISRNGEKVLTLGEGFRRKFTEKHRRMLIKLLQEARIEIVKKKK